MVNQAQSVSVVVIDRNSESRSSVKAYLTQAGARVLGETENILSGMSLVNGLTPDILILELPDHSDSTLDVVRKLKQDMPGLGIVITSENPSPQLILQCMRAGAQEFLTRPLNFQELGEAVQRLAESAQRVGTPKRSPGKVITVFSSKGGVGVTSIATNLAVSFAQNVGKRTAIVDLNMHMGDVGLLLDLDPKYTITDAVGVGSLDKTRLSGLMTEHESGVFLLSTPDDPVEAEMISPDNLLEVFSLLRSMFDMIIVDAGHFFDSRVLEVLNIADTILLIAGLDVPTVRNVHRCLTLFNQLGYTQEKVRLIVNREQTKSKVTLEDLEETAECKVFWHIPADYKTIIASIDAGVPAVIQNPKAKVCRNYADLSHELASMHGQGDEDWDLMEVEEAEEAPQGLRARFFGGR